MRRTASEETYLDMLTAAFLVGDGMKQIDIAHVLGVSQAAVSRLLARARKQYLKEEIRFLREKVPPATMQQIVRRAARQDLAERLDAIARKDAGVRGPVLRCFPCASRAALDRMTELGRFSAHWIRQLVLRCSSVGVTWGGMLSRVVATQRELSIAPPWKKDQPVDIIPLGGEPLGDTPTAYSSSSIAHEIGVIVNGETYNARSLAMVPAFVPDGFSRCETAGVWRLIGLVKSHAEIFGPHNGKSQPGRQALACNLDMILTSVGPAEHPLGFGPGTLLETGNVKRQELSKWVNGDMGGVLFPKARLTAVQKAKLDSVAARWTGLTVEHLRNCSRRAHNEADPFAGPPGVVVVCIGAERAHFLLEAVKLGLINHLIVDDELEAALHSLTGGAATEPSSDTPVD